MKTDLSDVDLLNDFNLLLECLLFECLFLFVFVINIHLVNLSFCVHHIQLLSVVNVHSFECLCSLLVCSSCTTIMFF